MMASTALKTWRRQRQRQEHRGQGETTRTSPTRRSGGKKVRGQSSSEKERRRTNLWWEDDGTIVERRCQRCRIMLDGVWNSKPKDIKSAFLDFYKDKFSCHDSSVSFPPMLPAHHLSIVDRDFLESMVSMDEIKAAVWDCGRKLQGRMGVHMALNDGLAANMFHGTKVGSPVGVSSNEVEIMASYMGCEAGFFPFTYLGLPIGLNMSCIASWQPLIDRFKARLSAPRTPKSLLGLNGRIFLPPLIKEVSALAILKRSVVPKLGSNALACKVIVTLDKSKLTMRETLLRCFTKGYVKYNFNDQYE
ncbi:hypothetical protein Tco_1338309 [Tanacetum coccineum]